MTIENDNDRKKVVKMYHDGESVQSLSKQYNVSDKTIYTWISKFSGLSEKSTHTQSDYAQLERKLKQQQDEIEVLKKAISIFSKPKK